MFPYRVQYADSESDIQNYNLFYKTRQQFQNCLKTMETNNNKSNIFKQNRKIKEFLIL